MPTGYTCTIKDGISFNEFVMKCARAMGACVTMRDEPDDAEIPIFEASSYHAKEVIKAQDEIDRLNIMTREEACEEVLKKYNQQIAARTKRNSETARLKSQYMSMLAKVRAWEAPTSEHDGLKSFMVQQLTESIDFDCCDYDNDVVVLESTEEYLAKALWKAQKLLAYHKTQYAKEVRRNSKRNKWVYDLKNSLR